jgi:hypothetical protein
VPKTWAEAPAPAKVVKKAAEVVGEGRRVTKARVPLVTNVVHWLYGTALGVVYGALASRARPGTVGAGTALGAGVWAAGYAELIPLGVYKPPWQYPPGEVALDLGYHLAYGVVAAGTFAALDR